MGILMLERLSLSKVENKGNPTILYTKFTVCVCFIVHQETVLYNVEVFKN